MLTDSLDLSITVAIGNCPVFSRFRSTWKSCVHFESDDYFGLSSPYGRIFEWAVDEDRRECVKGRGWWAIADDRLYTCASPCARDPRSPGLRHKGKRRPSLARTTSFLGSSWMKPCLLILYRMDFYTHKIWIFNMKPSFLETVAKRISLNMQGGPIE